MPTQITIHFPHTGDIVYYDGSSTTVLPAATYACLQTWCPLRAIKPTNKRSKFSTGRSHPILASLSCFMICTSCDHMPEKDRGTYYKVSQSCITK